MMKAQHRAPLLSAISDHYADVFLTKRYLQNSLQKYIEVKLSAASKDLFRNEIIKSEMYAAL